MAYFYLDDSKHHDRGFSLAAFIICDTDRSHVVRDIFRANGFDPATFEFKSLLPMKDNPALRRLRAELGTFIMRNARLAVCVVGNDAYLGDASLALLKKSLTHEWFAEEDHNVFFDEGLFRSIRAAHHRADEFPEFEKCTFYFEQDSKNIIGIQLADLVAHTCSTMLAETLGFIHKMIEIGEEEGYPDETKVELGWELWTGVRYNFLSEAKTHDPDDDDFAILNVAPYGLYIHDSVSDEVRDAAKERFGEMYVGCIH